MSLLANDFGAEHDACGVGFIAARDRAPSYRLTRLAVECLQRLDHRGAVAADGTGDGAGILTQIPRKLIERELRAHGLSVDTEPFGLVMCFLPPGDATVSRTIVTDALEAEGLRLMFWRSVPIDPSVLGDHARGVLPLIEQAVVTKGISDGDFERGLFLARKRMERHANPGFSIPSASSRSVVYKGLFTAGRISDFYWDLRDPDFETAYGLFHQRFSTNTFPSWENAQPFRTLAHNGEINTIRSNRSWMKARENGATPGLWGERLADVFPFLQPGLSDSASLDNAYELLMQSGRSLPHVKEMLIPAAWENVADMAPDLAAFYEYHAFLTEPWDGPAAIAVSDGISLLAGMDRNGLRPARWMLSPDVLVVASEAGVCPEEEARALDTGQLGPGEVVYFDGETGQISHSEEVKAELASQRPYGDWVNTETLRIQASFDSENDDRFDAGALTRIFGYTAEERRLILAPMAEGLAPLGSMGDDTGLAALSERPRRLTRYFHQMFAQVTNPPMDPIRERLVMSLRIQLGRRGPILEDAPSQAHLIELASPILSDAELDAIVRSGDPRFFSHWIPSTWDVSTGPEGLEPRLDAICEEAANAVRLGASILILSDRETSAQSAPIPILLAVGAVHHHLIDLGIRGDVSLVAVSGEPRDSHDVACLIGYGASAVNPYLAIDQVIDLARSGMVEIDAVSAQENYRQSLETGLLKIMSKMGICTLSAYRGSELFEVIGLSERICRRAFRNTPRRLRGVGMLELATQTLERHSIYDSGKAQAGGFYKHRRGEDVHVMGPKTVLALQKAVRSGDSDAWDTYLDTLRDRPAVLIRDLLTYVERDPIPITEVESADRIMRRFTTAAMSLGALSKEAHEALAEAMNLIGARSNSGEGGEDPARYRTNRNSAIKQVASGRFGVTPGYLSSADELQIKMAQGSKPGEGGQLPGHKVSEEIARLRHTEPGITLISPPPHHDIYSIEDLAQLIYDLKSFKPSVQVSVKLVSEPGVGTIAVGVAKADADVITLSGSEGGTGASPLISVKHAGSPWELGVAEAHQALVAKGLRSRVVLEADGGIRSGRDVIVAAMLGAERFGFGTLPLLALGCKMVRQCHANTCPVGIATQDLNLRAKFTGSAEQIVVLFEHVANEIRGELASLGLRSIEDIVGRADLLRPVDSKHPLSPDLAALLVSAQDRKRHSGYETMSISSLAQRMIVDTRSAIRDREPVVLNYPIRNLDRSIGARLSGEIASLHGDAGLPEGTIDVRLSGTAGQSFGAWLSQGVILRLEGTANDFVAKGMGGGVISVVPTRSAGTPQGAGNAVLYGATGGRLFIAGRVGQRFAVRNSGAEAVVEGCSDHGCEYMTGGTVLVLGDVGRNFGAGMTGGRAFIWDPGLSFKARLADTAPGARRANETDADHLLALIAEHHQRTGSPLAAKLLASHGLPNEFWVVAPSSSGVTTPLETPVQQQTSG
jgi:glutamate synthase domain-containing protein 2/glutamate synthase domain-containing protein 1/glutamate synthase domain-containing protein 3